MPRWVHYLRHPLRRRSCVSLERTVTPGQREAAAAMARASSATPVAEGLKAQASTTAEHLRRIRRRNHFSESIGELFGMPPH